MKKIYTILAVVCAPFWAVAQCTIQTTTTDCLCYGDCTGSATAQMSNGVPPYTYMWQPIMVPGPTVSGLCAGMYAVQGTDAIGCMAYDTITINQPASPLNSVFISNAATCPTCCDGAIHITAAGGTAPYQYNWSPSGGPGPNSTNLCPGTYSCCVVDSHGCSVCNTYTVTFMTGINDPAAAGELILFPSPAFDMITVQENFSNPVDAQLSVVNILGEMVYTQNIAAVTALNATINLSGFESGVYFIAVKTASGTTVQKFVKE